MASGCLRACGCWDCATDRRNSLRFALVVCASLAVLGGLFVTYEALDAFDMQDDDPPGAQLALRS
jgi:hypothetical protein